MLETNARKRIFEEIFYDLGTSKARVLWLNFFRGIFFGVGSVIGGTVVVALIAYILGLFIDVDSVTQSIDSLLNASTNR